MTRAKIIGIFLFIFEVTCFIGIGKFFFHKVPYKIWVDKDLIYEQVHEDAYTIEFNRKCALCGEYHRKVKVEINSEELEKIKTTGIINLPKYYSGYNIILFILYWFLIPIGGTMALVVFIKTIKGDFDDEKFSKHSYCCQDCFFKYRCQLYQKADEIDLDPMKNKWYKFWGYLL